MNIVHLVFSFNNGGIENLLVDIMNNYSDENNVTLCIINDDINEMLLNKINITKHKKIVCLKRTVGGKKIDSIIDLHKIVRQGDVDIIHCHSNNAFKFFLPIKLINNKIKIFMTIHDTIIYSNISKIDCYLHKIFIKKLFAISNSVLKGIVVKNINSNKVQVIYNGIDERKFLEKTNIDNKKKEIICVARLVLPIKGQDILLRAIKELSLQREDFICKLVGGTPVEKNNYLEKVKDLIKELDIQKYVDLVGDCNNIPEELSKADVFVLPSRHEGFGIALIEAMLSKTIVIASDVEGPKEIIQENKYGYLFASEDYNKLAEILNKVLDSDNKEVINRAYVYAKEEFTINNMINKMNQAYVK